MEPASASGEAVPRSVIDLLPVGVVLIDRHGAAHLANRAWTELTGQPEPVWRGHGWLDAFEAGQRVRKRSELLAATRSGGTYSGVWTAAGTADRVRPLHVVAVPDAAGGNSAALVVTVTDLTARPAPPAGAGASATHDPLTGLYSRSHFVEFVGHALDVRRRNPNRVAMVVVVGVDGLEAANETLGREAGDRLLTTVARRVAASARPRDIVARFGGDRFAVLCDDLRDADEAAAMAARIEDAVSSPVDGDDACAVSVGYAVSEHSASDGALLPGAAERAMRRARHERGAGNGRGDLDQLAIAAHELRTPLAAISSAVSRLADTGATLTGSDRLRTLLVIERQASRLAALLDSVFDLGRLAHTPPVPVPVDVAALVARALETAPPPDAVTLVVAIQAGRTGAALQALADEARVVQALVNLLTNAYRFGGPVVTVTGSRHPEHVEIEIEDDGPGVPADLVPQLFELFTRGDGDGAETQPDGYGIGLAVARKAVESVGGRLRHEAVMPHGARFIITLAAPPSR